MPRYTYKCKKCDQIFDVVHSIKEKFSSCEECNEECEEEGSLSRLPSSFTTNISKENLTSTGKAGNLVKEKIEEFKEELKQEKDKYKKQEFKNDT
jgi:putative FmdB family regulatory protein|tara:strand:- start:1816 stop:2100 length:285 start_codon:yes stop_codon:yes gene_type:complete